MGGGKPISWQRSSLASSAPYPDHSSKRSRFTRLAETNGILAANHSHLNEIAIAAQTRHHQPGGHSQPMSIPRGNILRDKPSSRRRRRPLLLFACVLQVAFVAVALRAQGKNPFSGDAKVAKLGESQFPRQLRVLPRFGREGRRTRPGPHECAETSRQYGRRDV